MDPVAVGALGELIATAVAKAAGWSWSSVRHPEARAIAAVIDAALADALSGAALLVSAEVDEVWVGEVADIWRPAFTPQMMGALIGCLTDPSADAGDRFSALARAALEEAGCDLADLGRWFWVEEFLALLPRRLLAELNAAALADPAVRGLVGLLLDQRAEARASDLEPVSPGEFRADLIAMMDGLARQARGGRLPGYLPTGADVTAATRTVRVREGLRCRPGEEAAGQYRPAAEQPGGDAPTRPWPEVMAEHRQLVVLGDAGLGKSWLIRTETLRLAEQARQVLNGPPGGAVAVPVPLRCDRLDAAPGTSLADKAAAHLVGQGLLAGRSRHRLAAMISAGEMVVLLDAADELTPGAAGRARELLRSWVQEAGEHARCVVTTRIAGYTGSLMPDAAEVELQAFTHKDVAAVVAAWQLPPAAAARLLDRVQDPAVGAMARIPLLLALLCSLAAQAGASDQPLPATRGQLYERVLRWFLTAGHRSPDSPAALPHDDIAVGAMLEMLAPLAFTFANTPGGWTDLMTSEQILTAIRSCGPAFTELGRPAAEILRELSTTAGILIPDGDPSAGRSPQYLFLHRTFAEYLVARHLAALPQEDWLDIIEQHRWFDPDWAQVIPMLGERLSPPDAATLIGHLLADQADPFCYSLLTAARIWGGRPDADHLLPAAMAADLARRLDSLLTHHLRRERDSVVSELAGMAYLPQRLLSLLLARLTDDDHGIRFVAVEALAGRDFPEVTAGLLARLHDDYPIIRCVAARALAGWECPEVTAALLDRVADEDDEDVHAGALAALRRRDSPEVTASLLAWLTDDSWLVRAAAAEALAGRDGPDVTVALLRRLADETWWVRLPVVRALAGRDGPEVTAALLARLADDNRSVGSAAAKALTGRDGPDVTAALLTRLTDDNDDVRSGAVRALAGRDYPEVTAALMARLTDDNDAVQAGALAALARRDYPEVTAALVDRLTNDKVWARSAGVKALAVRDGPEVTAALLARLHDSYPGIRSEAVRALAGRDYPEVTAALLARLGDDDYSVRSRAAEALAGRDYPEVTAALLTRLSEDNRLIRTAAAEALAGRDYPEVTAALLAQFGDDNGEVRAAAVRALAGRDGPEVTAALLARLGDDDRSVRFAAVGALAGRDGPEVTAALLARLTDDDRNIRSTAAEALAESHSPQALLTLAMEGHDLPRTCRPDLTMVARQLMRRHYLRIEPAARPVVRDAVARLTATGTMPKHSPGEARA